MASRTAERKKPANAFFLPGHDEAYAAYAKQDFPPEIYPEVMQRVGIDYMVVYPSIGLLSVTVPKLAADTAAAYRRAYNNWLADFCAAAGGRVFGAASIDLRDAQEAAREVRRCVTQFHFKAVHINPVPVCEHRLYDEFYEPLWETLEELDVPLAVHTGNGTAADEMLYYYLPRLRSAQTTVAFTIGNMLASTALIMGGVLERHPKLRVVHLESGAPVGPHSGLTAWAPAYRGAFAALPSKDSACRRSNISNASAISQPILTIPVFGKSLTPSAIIISSPQPTSPIPRAGSTPGRSRR